MHEPRATKPQVPCPEPRLLPVTWGPAQAAVASHMRLWSPRASTSPHTVPPFSLTTSPHAHSSRVPRPCPLSSARPFFQPQTHYTGTGGL